ncbi:MAG: FAD-binding oxidoreductase [Acidobacteria bacterium]|nr:MAG: FAD-binding oxidoreductase [Acidobacteriota bacterium]
MSEFSAAFKGRIITPDDKGYDEARKLWNGMVDKRPALIAQCMTTSDVVAAVDHARENGLEVAVRGGGHNVAGNASCDDGLVIDLRPMKAVSVDAEGLTARAEGGVTWGEYDHATQAHGLASPGGAISTTGIAGLTLGGGFGWLSRSYGLVCDNLLSAQIVTADGAVLIASTDKNPDLFWAIRGGGGNFGVVTRFEFRLHPVGELYAGLILYPRSAATDLLLAYARMTEEAPDALSGMAAFLCSPEGDPVVGVFAVYHGPADEGARAVTRLRAVGSPLLDDIGPKPYTRVQQAFDEAFPPGNRNYWKSGYVSTISDDYIDVLVEHANRAPSPLCVVGLEHMMGGAVSRVDKDDSAFGMRDAEYNLLILGITNDSSKDGAVRDWVRGMSDAVRPFSTGSVYVNYMDHDELDRISDAYGPAHYGRLQELKKRYDPDNLFRSNQNITPAV